QRAGALGPDTPAVRLPLGLLAYARDDLQTSLAELTRSQHSPFTRQRACSQLAAVHQRLGNTAQAATFSERAAALPRDLHWLDPFLLESAQGAVGRSSRVRLIEQMEAEGKLREAVEKLREMVAERPDYRVYVGLGKDLAQLGDLQGAEQALRLALQQVPNNANAHFLLGGVFLLQAQQHKDPDGAEARELFRACGEQARLALAQKPDHALAHMLLGVSLKHLGDREAGLAELQRAVDCAPEVADTHLNLGELLAEIGRTEEARSHLEQAVQLARPGNTRPREALERFQAAQKK